MSQPGPMNLRRKGPIAGARLCGRLLTESSEKFTVERYGPPGQCLPCRRPTRVMPPAVTALRTRQACRASLGVPVGLTVTRPGA